MGFFNPAILTQNFVQSRNPEGYLGHSNSRILSVPNLARFCFKIPNSDLQITREILDPEKPIGDPLLNIKAKFEQSKIVLPQPVG